MPLDSRSKRRSSTGILQPWRPSLPLPLDSPGVVDQADQQESAWTYSGIAAAGVLPPVLPQVILTGTWRVAPVCVGTWQVRHGCVGTWRARAALAGAWQARVMVHGTWETVPIVAGSWTAVAAEGGG